MQQTITMEKIHLTLIEIKQQMVSKQELEHMLETIEILHNPKTMKQVHSSEQDIRTGRTKPIRNVKDLLAEL